MTNTNQTRQADPSEPTNETKPVTKPGQPSGPRVLLTVEQTAERLGIGRTTTFALIKSGELESVRVGRLRRVPETAIEAYTARLIADQH